MKRDMELIRELLLKLEAFGHMPLTVSTVAYWDLGYEEHRSEEVIHHLELLVEAGYVQAAARAFDNEGTLAFKRLTWSGYEFLDTIRDPEVWKKTKDGASKVGSWSVGFIKDLGTAYAKHLAKERLGLEL
jgi:hypothetical protein